MPKLVTDKPWFGRAMLRRLIILDKSSPNAPFYDVLWVDVDGDGRFQPGERFPLVADMAGAPRALLIAAQGDEQHACEGELHSQLRQRGVWKPRRIDVDGAIPLEARHDRRQRGARDPEQPGGLPFLWGVAGPGNRNEALVLGVPEQRVRAVAIQLDRQELAQTIEEHGGFERGNQLVAHARQRCRDRRLLFQLLLRTRLLDTQAFLFEGVGYCGTKTSQAVLEQVIGRALPHCADGRIFADGAGDDDERDVPAALVQQVQRAYGVELGQRMIGEDEVQLWREAREVFRLGVHTLPRWIEAGTPEVMQHQLGVGLAVLKDQHSQRYGGHAIPPNNSRPLGWHRPH
jgi:hypothetical protein